MKRLLIGDIHGCYDELQALLDLAGLSSKDEIIALGDVVDRGPATERVLEFFRTTPHARTLMGNHERKHLRSFRREVKAARSQFITRTQLGERYPTWLQFIETFPRGLELDEAMLVHGYWEPGKTLAAQNDMVIMGTLGGEKIVTRLCGDKWYEAYNGDKPLIVGHHDYLRNGQPLIYRDRIFGLDTSCCQGGALTGLLLPAWQIISVPSRADHWQEAKLAYRVAHPPPPPIIWTTEDEVALAQIFKAIQQRTAALLAELAQAEDFAQLTQHQQGKRFAERVGRVLLARYLYRARLGTLTLEGLRRGLRDPLWARELVGQLEKFLPPIS